MVRKSKSCPRGPSWQSLVDYSPNPLLFLLDIEPNSVSQPSLQTATACDHTLASGMSAEVTCTAPELTHKSSFTIIAFFHQQSSGWMSPEGDLGSYVLKMTKLWPTWIPDQSLHEQQMKFCIRPLRHGGLSK